MPPIDVFEAQVAQHEVQINAILEREVNYVTYKQFYIVIGFLVSLFLGMTGLIWSQLHEIAATGNDTKDRVSYIQGTLQNASVTK